MSDGNARLSATRFGPDADAMANRVQLYYGPMPGPGRQQSLSAAVASAVADASNPESFLSFTSRAGSSGLINPPSPSPLVSMVATGQGVPIARHLGGLVRLFFEAQGDDGRTRIMSVDSTDGYVGLDFNSGSATTCSTAADYSAGGGCAPTVAIGVAGDVDGNSRISNARQFKVAWPTLESPHWDLAVGTFMVFTVDRVPGCLDFPFNQAGMSTLPFLGPKKLMYADGGATGAPDVVDFEDWEAQASARDVVFLWPNGDQMDARAEGYIDDYHLLAPTGALDLQVMYLTITDGAIAPISATAVLRNP